VIELALVGLDRDHPGLTAPLAAAYAEAAAVCLSRHHTSPVEIAARLASRDPLSYSVAWLPPDARTLGAWANERDATESGAYAICLATARAYLGLVAVRRAEGLTGADYYLGPEPQRGPTLNLEDAVRLEVSGVDRGSEASLLYRLGRKVEQAQAGRSALPALAVVVGFLLKQVIFREVPDVA
jgi:hypothetical protein